MPPPETARRSGRSTALLLAVALVVAVAAGGSVYALMNGSDDDGTEGTPTVPPRSSAPVSPGPTTGGPSPDVSSSAPADGAIPTGYLGTWSTTLDNDAGHHTRQLTIRQGEVGDTVLSLVADGADYHCVFQASLTQAPAGDGALAIGPSTVTVGEPAASCTPGAATELTLLGDGSLERVNTDTGEKLTYTKE